MDETKMKSSLAADVAEGQDLDKTKGNPEVDPNANLETQADMAETDELGETMEEKDL